MPRRFGFLTAGLAVGLAAVVVAQGPAPQPLPRTPLPQPVLTLLSNEISGQMAFNNEVRLAGAPWVRDLSEFGATMYETQKIYDLVRGYGIETTRIERSASDRKVDYPAEGELWITEPDMRLVARLGADSALVAGGSSTADLTAELAYLPPAANEEQMKAALAAAGDKFRGKVVLAWSHVRDPLAKQLDAAGIQGVISFGAQDRYLDPNQVLYSSGSYKNPTLRAGMTVSWRQWSELLEDVQRGQKVVVRMKTRVESVQDKFEAVFSWIPGTEPDAKGVIFTAHLFEGVVKRGANDDMSGCAVQLEILRALHTLIASGRLPRPRRTIYFLWPQEISGTYDFIKQHPGFAEKLSANLNMDMVGEALRRNNGLLTMSECPDHLPCYIDGLAKSVMTYVWRTNDIVYLPDAPRGRPGGQYFPRPMVEKNGSDDAFRFFIHRATGGSDHICFNNRSVGVPGVEFFTWPDQWYHADADTPDKSDPTEMRRIAFIGAATAWAGANATDEVASGLADVVSDFGYARVAERDLPRALGLVEQADGPGLDQAASRAFLVADFAVDREIGALRTIDDVSTGSAAARRIVENKVQQWELYRSGLKQQLAGFARLRQAQFPATAGAHGGTAAAAGRSASPARPRPVAGRGSSPDKGQAAPAPVLASAVKGREFALQSWPKYAAYLKEHPDALKTLGVSSQQATSILNYVDGKRSIQKIRDTVVGETGRDIAIEAVAGYLELLKTVGWVSW
jgi:aminopeptidase YwaD